MTEYTAVEIRRVAWVPAGQPGQWNLRRLAEGEPVPEDAEKGRCMWAVYLRRRDGTAEWRHDYRDQRDADACADWLAHQHRIPGQ